MGFFQKKKVLLVSPSGLNNGGVQSVLMTIVRELSDSYIFDILVFNNYQTFYKDEFMTFGGKIYLVNKSEGGSLFTKIKNRITYRVLLNKTLDSLFKEKKYDIVHSNNQFDSEIVLKKAKKYNISQRICHSHGFYPKSSFIIELLRNKKRKAIKKNATKLIGCSKEACESLFGPSVDYTIINNPYDNRKIFFSEKTPKKLSILQIGMFNDNKNQLFSLDVLYNLQALTDVELHFMGTGDNSKIIKKIKDYQLEDKVIFHTHNDNKMLVFENASYLIMPSKREGFGIALIEAQGAGLYCFASNTIPKSTNCDGVFYLNLNDGAKKWAEEIYAFYKKNKGFKEPFNCSAFTIENFINKVLKIYNE